MVHPKVPKELKKMEDVRNDQELNDFQEGNPDILIIYKSPSLENFIFGLRGPKDTIFEGALFRIHCHIPQEYPFKPPIMQFMTKVWHPNISSVVWYFDSFVMQTGAICLDILKDKWTPAMNMATALLSIQALLTAAEPDDPQVILWNFYFYLQDGVVAKQYMEDHAAYEKKARDWVRMYAQEGMTTEKDAMVFSYFVYFTNRLTKLLREVRILIMSLLY